jgi:hypothetical protein
VLHPLCALLCLPVVIDQSIIEALRLRCLHLLQVGAAKEAALKLAAEKRYLSQRVRDVMSEVTHQSSTSIG